MLQCSSKYTVIGRFTLLANSLIPILNGLMNVLENTIFWKPIASILATLNRSRVYQFLFLPYFITKIIYNIDRMQNNEFYLSGSVFSTKDLVAILVTRPGGIGYFSRAFRTWGSSQVSRSLSAKEFFSRSFDNASLSR